MADLTATIPSVLSIIADLTKLLMELRAQAGMEDEALLTLAEKHGQEVRASVAAHIAAVRSTQPPVNP